MRLLDQAFACRPTSPSKRRSADASGSGTKSQLRRPRRGASVYKHTRQCCAIAIGFGRGATGSILKVFSDSRSPCPATSAASWLEASLLQRQQIQRAIFPNGLPFRRSELWNRRNMLTIQPPRRIPRSWNVASPAGFEPAVSALKGQRVGPATPWVRWSIAC